jgi:thiol-disulfide isomerase/thioredoxin
MILRRTIGISVVLAFGFALGCGPAAGPNPAAAPASAASAANDPEKAWAAFVSVLTNPPSPPPPGEGKAFDSPEVAAWRKKREEVLVSIVDQAKDFYTRFPNDPNAAVARIQEKEFTEIGVQMGVAKLIARLDPKEVDRIMEPERFGNAYRQVNLDAIKEQSVSQEAAIAKLEEGARRLIKEFPKRPESFSLLVNIMMQSDNDKARKIAEELVAHPAAPEQLKAQGQSLLNQMVFLGQTLDLKFTAVDGRKVDLAALKGKVVLLDFWATWCGPCVEEMPSVKATYQKLHEKGFEIVGINFDQDKDRLRQFVQEMQLPWPQYFEESDAPNVIGAKYKISSFPTMWMLDKTGKLREMNGRINLAAKVEKLLAE